MAKKGLLVLALAGLTAGGVFAQTAFSISAGAGGFFDGMFGSQSFDGTKMGGSNAIGGGAYGFFDATFAEIDIDILLNGTQQTDKDGKVPDGSGSMGGTYFGFSVLGKYPFALGDKFSIFPLVGIDYQMILSAQYKDKDGKDVGSAIERSKEPMKIEESMDMFSIGAGVGGDFNLTEKLFLRGEFLWNFKLDSKSEADMKKDNKKYTTFTSGPRVKLAVGFKF